MSNRMACFVPNPAWQGNTYHRKPLVTQLSFQKFALAPWRIPSRQNFRQSIRTTCVASERFIEVNGPLTVRLAKERDITGMAKLTARAFCEQDQFLVFLRTKVNLSLVKPLIFPLEVIYERLSAKDIALQLKRRVGPKKQPMHVVLVAESETGEMMGCIEMGLIGTRRMSNARAGYAIEQWEKSIAEASRMKRSENGNRKVDSDIEPDNNVTNNVENGTSANMNGNDTRALVGRAPYIGNLAVSQDFRRRGVASELVIEACRWSKTLWGAPCVWLHVEEENQAATRLYKKLEFGCETQDPDWVAEVGRQKRLLLRSGGGSLQWSDARETGVKLNGLEYVRWCWNDLARVRRENQN